LLALKHSARGTFSGDKVILQVPVTAVRVVDAEPAKNTLQNQGAGGCSLVQGTHAADPVLWLLALLAGPVLWLRRREP